MKQSGKTMAQKENIRGRKSFELQDDSTVKDDSRLSASVNASATKSNQHKKNGVAVKRSAKFAQKEQVAK